MRARDVVRTWGIAAVLTILCWPAAAQATFPGQAGKIAFEAGSGIHVIEADGSGLALVIPGGQDPAWSAEGSRLAYFDGAFPGALLVANGDGSAQTVLRTATFSSGSFGSRQDRFFEPAWAPDGGTIAYAEVDSGCGPFVGCHDAPEGVRVIGADGSGDRPLLESPAGDPAYSADGARIAWAEHPFFQPRVHVSNADGTGDTVLTQFDPNTGIGAAHDPSWSPDGTRIAFTRLVTANNSEIYTMTADGTNQTRLTFGSLRDEDPVWSPDGTRIAWSNNGRLWVMNADGSGQASLTAEPVLGRNPDWQPLVGPRREDYKNASHFCKAEREFLGDAAFRQQYGNHGGCVSGKR